MKNEARRFITLLDALYECRCKLIITAAAGPDDIFFPEKAGEEESDALLSETFAEAYQDVTAPFRPNILSENPNYAEPDAEPDYTHARLAGLLNADALEDDPPNKPRRNPFGRSFGRTDSEMERKPIDPDEPRYTNRPNFSKSGAFTGEDERFAYKRAQSRLWEMCGAKWWARSEADWHRPLPINVRAWEKSNAERALAQAATTTSVPGASSDVTMGEAQEDNTRDARSFKHSSASPFRTSTEEPPKISWTHIWGSGVPWGKKAGAWGKGPEGLKDRGNEKR
jgi:protein AFG1